MLTTWRRTLLATAAVAVVALAMPEARAQTQTATEDATGLLGALRRLAGDKAQEPSRTHLDVLRALGSGIEASGAKARLRELSLKPGRAALKLDLEDERGVFDVKQAINLAYAPTVTAEESKITPASGGMPGVTAEYAVALALEDRITLTRGELASKDLGEHICVTAAQMRVPFESFERVSVGKSPRGDAEKISYRLDFGRLAPDAVAGYCTALEASWPGLVFEEILIREAPRPPKSSPAGAGWKTTAIVSMLRSKTGR